MPSRLKSAACRGEAAPFHRCEQCAPLAAPVRGAGLAGLPTLAGLLTVAAGALMSCRVDTASLVRQARWAEKQGHQERACGLWARVRARPDLTPRLRFRSERVQVRCAHAHGTLVALQQKALARLHRDPVHAHYVLALATSVAAGGDLQTALHHLRAAQRQAPQEPEIPYRMGRILLSGDRFSKAIGPLRTALRLQPAWPRARVALATALVSLGRIAEARKTLLPLPKGNPSPKLVARASRLMTRAARLRDPVPPAARPLLDKALGLLRLEFTAAASDVLRKAAERFPRVSTFALLYGLTMVRLSNYAAALSWLRKAERLNPADPRPATHLGAVLAKTGHLEDARAAYQRACALDPVHPTAHAGLGLTLLRLRRIHEALPVLRRAAVLAGGSIEVLDPLAQALAASDRLDDAIQLLRRAARAEDPPPGLLVRLARLLLRRYRTHGDATGAEQDFQEALDTLRRALRADPKHIEARTLLDRLTGKAAASRPPTR